MTSAQEKVGVRIRDLRKHFPLPHGFLATLFSRRGGPDSSGGGRGGSRHRPRRDRGRGRRERIGEDHPGDDHRSACMSRRRGPIWFGEQDISHLQGEALKAFRREAQIVFQDPYGSLDPRVEHLRHGGRIPSESTASGTGESSPTGFRCPCSASVWIRRGTSSDVFPTSSRAANDNGWPSPEPLCSSPGFSSPTSPSPCWTCR